MAKPQIMFYHDGRHPHIYRYEPPMQKEEFQACIDELVGTPVEAVTFCLGEGRTMLHDTKAGELLGDNVEKWGHLIFRRAHQNAKHLIGEGNDPLRIVCERAHEKGMLLYPALLVQGSGNSSAPDRNSNFRKQNTHLEIGAGGDLDPSWEGAEGNDFKHKETRDERFAIIEEALTDYPVDGFELNLNMMPYYFHPNEIESGRPIMTDWIGQIHEKLKKSGSDRELAIRIPYRLEDCYATGLDVEDWIKRGIVDALIGETFIGQNQVIDPMCDFRPLIASAKNSDCRVLAALKSHVGSDRLGDAPISMIRATACNYWAQGIDGIYVAHWFTHWPYQKNFYEMMREIPHPDIMANKDKFYHTLTAHDKPVQNGVTAQLPSTMKLGQPTTVNLTISDDLPRWDNVDRVHEVLLRIGIQGTTELDRISFKLNGEELPTDSLRVINQAYRMSAPRHRAGPTYWFVFRLDRSHWPIQGNNTLEVTLIERDPDLAIEISLRDLELEIKYLMGKNFHRGYVDQDLGPYEHAIS